MKNETSPRPTRADTIDAVPAVLRRLFGDDLSVWMPGGVSPFPLVHVPQDATLIHEGAPARSIHVIQAGHFKIVRTCEDGYEQVLEFADSGELLGCDGLADGFHASAAVALEESWVFALPTQEVQRLCLQLPACAMRWQAEMAAQIARAGDRAWVMGAVGAEKRVARFVLQHLHRQAAHGESERRLHLRMGRRDMASHLGLSHESVSRAFTLLDDAGMLRVDNREVTVLDRDTLQALACTTRGYPSIRRSTVPHSATPRTLRRPALDLCH